MREHGFNVGGEQSGHIILSDYATTGDGLIAALQVLAVVKTRPKPVSEVCHRFEPLPQVLKNVRFRKAASRSRGSVVTAIEASRERLGKTAGWSSALRHRAGDPRHGRRRRPRRWWSASVDDVVEALTKRRSRRAASCR